jgi:hypothetical protein
MITTTTRIKPSDMIISLSYFLLDDSGNRLSSARFESFDRGLALLAMTRADQNHPKAQRDEKRELHPTLDGDVMRHEPRIIPSRRPVAPTADLNDLTYS